MNQVGEPDAGNPHVRFDERRLETRPNKSARQSSTLLNGILESGIWNLESGFGILESRFLPSLLVQMFLIFRRAARVI